MKYGLVNDVPRLFQAFVAPAIFVSAGALLVLSLNTRLMGMVSRLRQYLHQEQIALAAGRIIEAGVCAAQVASIERRAEMIRRAFVFVLASVTGTVASCILLGAGLFFEAAALLAAFLFSVAILALLAGSVFYWMEVPLALTSVRHELADSDFADLAPGDAAFIDHYSDAEAAPQL